MKHARANSFDLVAVFASGVVIAVLAGGCQPGALPCTKDKEWEGICKGNLDAAETGGSGGQGGGTGGSRPGGMGGGTGGAASDPLGETKIANCAAYETVASMDKFFQDRCSDQPVCHGLEGFSDFKMPGLYKRILTMKTRAVCVGAMPIADPVDPKKGAIWAKIQPMPVCPDMKPAGSPMPSGTGGPLTDAERKCLEGYLDALTKAPK